MVRPFATGYPPFRMWMSVPQIVVVVMRTSASSGPTSGMGLPSRTMRPGSTKTAAFICGIKISIPCNKAVNDSEPGGTRVVADQVLQFEGTPPHEFLTDGLRGRKHRTRKLVFEMRPAGEKPSFICAAPCGGLRRGHYPQAVWPIAALMGLC